MKDQKNFEDAVKDLNNHSRQSHIVNGGIATPNPNKKQPSKTRIDEQIDAVVSGVKKLV